MALAGHYRGIANMQNGQEKVTRFGALTHSRVATRTEVQTAQPLAVTVFEICSLTALVIRSPGAGEVAEFREDQATARGLSVGMVILVTAKLR